MLNFIPILRIFPQVIHDLSSRKMRLVLAVFCVAWGVMTTILLLALGNGFYESSKNKLQSVVDGVFFVFPGVTSKNYLGWPQGSKVFVQLEEAENIKKALNYIRGFTPIESSLKNISFQDKKFFKIIYGVSTDLVFMRNINLTPESRFFNELDYKDAKRFVILGTKLKTALMGNTDAVGKDILINNITFKVIGILEKSPKNMNNSYDDVAIIPYTTFIALQGKKVLNSFAIVTDPQIDPRVAEQGIRKYFSFIYHFAVNDKSALRITSSTEMLQFFRWFFFGVKLFLIFCGALAIGVSCLGTANIMFYIVAERTHEVGVRIALGATDFDIFGQFLTEALLILGVGGLIGFYSACLITSILQYVYLPPWLGSPFIKWIDAVITLFVLGFFGILSSYMPARRAALLDPTDALRVPL